MFIVFTQQACCFDVYESGVELIYRKQTKVSKDFHVPVSLKLENILLNCIAIWLGFIVFFLNLC